MTTKPPARAYSTGEAHYLTTLYAAKAWGYRPGYAGWPQTPILDALEAEKLISRSYGPSSIDPDQQRPLYSLTRKGRSEAYRIIAKGLGQ